MKMKASVPVLLILLCALVLLQEAAEVEGATCNPMELTPCAGAFMSSSTPPSGECCAKLKSQSSCFCQYKKDPTLGKYFGGGQRVIKACGIASPTC
ncbi:non-specific lipid-transfer protein 2-like [Canna indica]|uniref:Non-specific lipid-transfer protein 2-like n=1 Tax=Canna indica TaxID=4628 RepID=A0AAQ3QII0_9LILI|nr:non-specific lipid-transfer protein 2-like [Canna indica]